MGNSLGLFAVSNAGLNSSESAENSTGSECEERQNATSQNGGCDDEQSAGRRRFPRLGVSSYFIGTKSASKSCESSESESSTNPADESSSSTDASPRTSTPQQSPTKPAEVEVSPVLAPSPNAVVDQLPDFLNPCLPAGQPLPTVEDLLYPGIAREKQRDNRVLKNSKKMFESVKTKTTAGLSKVKSSISELVKSERCEAELEKEIFEKITKLARESTDDFSIHMIEEASLQRLTAAAPAMPECVGGVGSRQRQFPPVGAVVEPALANQSAAVSPLLVPKTIPGGGAKRVRRSRRSATNDVNLKKDLKSQSKRRKAITEVRKRVQEAHVKEQRLAELSKGFNPQVEGAVPFHHRVPRCYNGRKLVYTRQGQVPQYRNGQLDWNYLWFFSDSSTTTNSTTEATQLNASSNNTMSSNETSDSEPATPDERVQKSSKSKSSRVRSPAMTSSTPPRHHHHHHHSGNQSRLATPPSTNSPNSIMRQAKKKRIRRLAPPSDDNVQLLGMI